MSKIKNYLLDCEELGKPFSSYLTTTDRNMNVNPERLPPDYQEALDKWWEQMDKEFMETLDPPF